MLMTMMNSHSDNSFLLDGMTWSYSRIGAYNTCPYAFKSIYLDCEKQVDNAYAQWGSLMHDLLANIYLDRMTFAEAKSKYIEMYELEVGESFGLPSTDDSYYFDGLDMLSEEYNPVTKPILAVEHKFVCDIDGIKFTGFIDLVAGSAANDLHIIDHKSKKTVTAKDYIQLYLYAHNIWLDYGEFPKTLSLNLIRARQLKTRDFSKKEYVAALDWAKSTIEKIYDDALFVPTPSYFYCKNLCGIRHLCEEVI